MKRLLLFSTLLAAFPAPAQAQNDVEPMPPGPLATNRHQEHPRDLVGRWYLVEPKQPEYQPIFQFFRDGGLRIDWRFSESCSKEDKKTGVTRHGLCYSTTPGDPAKWSVAGDGSLCLALTGRGWKSGCREFRSVRYGGEDLPAINVPDIGILLRADSVPEKTPAPDFFSSNRR